MGKGQVERSGRFDRKQNKPIKKNISKKDFDRQRRFK